MGGMVGRLLARVFCNDHRCDSDFRVRIADLHSDAGQPLSAAAQSEAWSRLSRSRKGLRFASPVPTSTRCRNVLRHRFATMIVALLMLVGTVYFFKTMPTGFIPSQDSGFIFGVSMAGQDISYRVHGRSGRRPSQMSWAPIRMSRARWRFSSGEQRRLRFSIMKPRNERKLTVDETIEELRPEAGASSRHHDVSPKSAADHDQRPVHDQHLSDDRAERQPERHL